MEKFAQFGVEPILLLAQIVNFVLLVYLLKRFLYKPITQILKKREDKIREGIAAGARGEELLAKAKDEEKEILAHANEETNALLKDTRQRIANIEEEAITRAKEDAGHILEKAGAQIEEERKRVERELEKNAVRVAIGMLEQILPKLLTKQDQLTMVKSSEKLLRKVLP